MPLTIGGRREGKGAGEGTRGQERGQGGRIGSKGQERGRKGGRRSLFGHNIIELKGCTSR